MQRKFHIVITMILILLCFTAQGQIDVFNQKAQSILETYENNGRIDYNSLSKNKDDILMVTKTLSKVNTADLPKADLKAFLINAYNMTVIASIIEHYPTTSVMNIDGFFDKNKHDIAGKSMTLNELEKGWLFNKFPDARLHFAVVCGAISCPPITGTIFKGANLESRLDKMSKAVLNNPKFITIDMHEKKATVSKLFDWYATDFKKSGSVMNFINTYSNVKVPDGFSLDYMSYNWKLNKK